MCTSIYRIITVLTILLYNASDFFPVILTFLRQLPIIGNVLSMPYIREVMTLFFFR